MANQTVKVTGGHYQQDIISGKLIILHQRHIARALKNHGPTVVKDLRKVTGKGPRSGRLYTYRGRKYRASASGEPPAYRSGRLNKSFTSTPRMTELLIANTAHSKRGFPYPRHLEENMNRPFFVPTIERLQSDLYRDLAGFTGA